MVPVTMERVPTSTRHDPRTPDVETILRKKTRFIKNIVQIFLRFSAHFSMKNINFFFLTLVFFFFPKDR